MEPDIMKNGRIILKATLKNLSPVIIGSGQDNFTDRDIVTTLYKIDKEGNILSFNDKSTVSQLIELPFIPATSFLGKIYTLLDIKQNGISKIWGISNEQGDNGNASFIDCSDILIKELPQWAKKNNFKATEIRDSIRIDNSKGTVADGAKFNYEILGTGVGFEMTMIFRVESPMEDSKKSTKKTEPVFAEYQTILDIALSISHIIEQGFEIGSKSDVGFGRMSGKTKLYELDFENKSDFSKWINNKLDNEENLIKKSGHRFVRALKDSFIVTAKFKIKNSLIIRSYSKDPKMPDSTHLKSGGNNIIPGNSIKGSLRSRSERILNTILDNNHSKVDTYITGLFGDVEKENRQKVKRQGYTVPSRVFIDEVLIEETKEELQTRIQIDRFTGGTVDSALIEEVPLYPNSVETTQINNFKLRVKEATSFDKGLMLLLLKDLWTSDLPIGGEKSIGRGILEGVSAIIDDGGVIYKFPEDFKNHDKTAKLQIYVDSLTNQESINFYVYYVNKYLNKKYNG